jgi:hypothetical protein
LFSAIVVGLSLMAATRPALGQQTAVSIQRAAQEGKVEVRVSSLGGATGSTVRVDVRRKAPQAVQVEVTPGTVFLSASGTVQNMAGGTVKGEFNGPNTYQPGNSNVIVLGDDAWHGYLVESFCMDYHKGPPRRGDLFNLAIEDQRVARILQAKDPKTSLWAFQFALWMDREGISEKELLSRYGNVASEADVRVARNLMTQAEQSGVAGIPADMPAGVRAEVQKLFSPDPAVRAAAVQVLVKMGKAAAPAAPFLAQNVTTPTPGQLSHSTWLNILTNPQETSVTLDQTGLPDLKALADILRERRAARNADGKETPERTRLRERIRQREESATESKQP